MSGILTHPSTKSRLEAFMNDPAPALLLVGETGAGKLAAAKHVAASLLGIDPKKIDAHPGFIYIAAESDKKEISIDQIREVIRKLTLKFAGTGFVRRVVLINMAQQMSHPAQNSLLKVLEEPPADAAFILTASSPAALLPTIVSRCRLLAVSPTSLSLAKKHYNSNFSDAAIVQAWSLAGGNAGLLDALLGSKSNHPLKSAAAQAKQLIKSPTYERILVLGTAAVDKTEFEALLDGLARVLAALHKISIQKNSPSKKLLADRRLVRQARQDLHKNVNPGLLALNLALNLKTGA